MTEPERFNLALQKHQAGDLGGAEILYRQILAVHPHHHESLHLLAMLACQAGKNEDAHKLVQLAILIHPAAEYYTSLGVILGFLGGKKEAAAAFRKAVELKPEYPQGHNNLGSALATLKEWTPAVESFRTALAQRPEFVDAHFNLAVALLGAKDYDGAIAALCRAIELRPDFTEAHGTLGNALSAKGELQPAIDCFRKAAELQPRSALAHASLAAALCAAGEFDEALAEAKSGIEINPNHADAHVTKGVIHLLRGELKEGWNHYEHRRDARHLPRRIWSSQPQWDGTSGEGTRLLLHSEGEPGDTIQFARYATLAARRGCKVYLAVPANLLPVVRGIEGVQAAVSLEQPLPPFNAQSALMSMPHVLGTTLADIPAEIPYINADTALADRWRAKFDAGDNRRKIGIALEKHLSPPADIRNVHWVDLQRENDLKDFGDTAALLANLDLIICAHMAVAHLAGAMGKPVWVLLPFVPDWRWMLQREDSPWYPTMRLFRQQTAGDWDGVWRWVTEALRNL